MSSHGPALTLDEELAKLEETARMASMAITNARTVREAIAAAEVDVPHHLITVARTRVPTLGRLRRVRDLRIEDIVREQLAALQAERSDLVAIREFDRVKASDWSALRTENPDLYSKSLHEANLIIQRKSKAKK